MDADRGGDTVGNTAQRTDRSESILEAIHDGIFVIDREGTIVYVNDAIGSFTGKTPEELVGATVETLVDSGLFRSGEHSRFADSVTALVEGDTNERWLTLETAQEDSRTVEVRLTEQLLEGDTREVVGVVRDVTEREQQRKAAERKHDVLAKLYSTGANTDLTFEEKIDRILSIGSEYLNLPYGFLTRIDDGTQRILHAVGDHERLQPDESVPLERSYCRKTIENDDLVGIEDARPELGANDPAYQWFGLQCYVGTKVLVGDELYGTFCFAAPTPRDRTFTPDEREVIKLLSQWTGYELERQRFEERLRGLHRTAQRLLVAETTEEVTEIAVRAGANLFDGPVTAYWEYDPRDDVLRPVAETEACLQVIGEMPTFDRGDLLIWRSFDSGEIRSYGDATDRSGIYNSEADLRSEVHVPIGEYGVIISASTEPGAYDGSDVESIRLLATLLEAAMTAVEREETLVERGEALQRQNERLEEFAHVVAHDLRNPLAGAIGFLEISRETHDEDHFDRVETSLDRMGELMEKLLDIARGTREAVDPRELSLSQIVEEAWSYTDTEAAVFKVADELGEIYADETRLLQLFGNLFRNSVEHAGPEVSVEVGRLESGSGFYVEDDGPGLTGETREDVLTLGRTSSETGIGIGLDSVTDIVAAHGWELTIPETDTGARFEIRTDGAEKAVKDRKNSDERERAED